MKWRETPTEEMEKNTDRRNGEKHRHIKLPETLIDKIGEQHRQIKWRATPTDEMERNTDR
jgi:hypothetical protein